MSMIRRTLITMVLVLAAGSMLGAQMGAKAGIAGHAPGRFRLLGHETLLATTVTLTPSNIDSVETLTGPTTLDVRIPADRKRTNVVLQLTQSYNWHQVPSAFPLRASIGARLFIRSSALPAPGSFEALSFFAEGRSVAGSPSLEDDLHSSPWQSRYQLDIEFMAMNLQFQLGLNPTDAQALAAKLMQSDLEFAIQPTATVRSVSSVSFGRIRSLQVWGD